MRSELINLLYRSGSTSAVRFSTSNDKDLGLFGGNFYELPYDEDDKYDEDEEYDEEDDY